MSILFSGSAGSSIKSSSSPNGEDSRPTSSRPASGQSFIRHSIDRSFGQSILKRANNQSVKSVRTHDLVDRDEDAETTYSRQSIRLLESPRLILSRDHLIFPAFLRTVVQKYNGTLILLLRASPRLSTNQNTEWVVNDANLCFHWLQYMHWKVGKKPDVP